MASRGFTNRNLYGFIPGLVHLHCKVTFGTTGAATISENIGVTSVTKDTGTGLYTFVLDDYYQSLVGMEVVQVKATVTDTVWQITSDTIATAKTLGVDCFKRTTSSAANPSSMVALFNFFLDNSGT